MAGGSLIIFTQNSHLKKKARTDALPGPVRKGELLPGEIRRGGEECQPRQGRWKGAPRRFAAGISPGHTFANARDLSVLPLFEIAGFRLAGLTERNGVEHSSEHEENLKLSNL
jgi:hypothetical protein